MSKQYHFKLLPLIRAACTAQAWAQGEKLVAGGGVEELARTDEEIELRVHVRGALVSPTVVLYPEDDDWECDCPINNDNCAHVAAAAIAVGAGRINTSSPEQSPQAHTQLKYCFSPRGGGLGVERFFITKDGTEIPLTRPLADGLTSHKFPHEFHPSKGDLAVDLIIGRAFKRHAPLHSNQVEKIFNELSGSRNIYWQEKPVEISDEPFVPRIVIRDKDNDGIRLEQKSNKGDGERLAPGVMLRDNTLHRIVSGNVAGMGRVAAECQHHQLAEFATQILPNLREHFDVQIKTDRLPTVSRFLQPRIVMDMDQQEHTLRVLPRLVYGTPPHVRIEDDKMVYLQGAVPIRDKKEERHLTETLRDDLNLVFGRRVAFEGKDALRFMTLVREWGEEMLDSSQQPLGDEEPLVAHIELDDDKVDISFIAGGKDSAPSDSENVRHAEVGSVLSAWREGLNMAPLFGGGWAPIPKAWLDQYGDLVSDILAARGEDKKVATAALPILANLCHELSLPHQPCFDRIAPLLEKFDSIPETPLPEDLTATLRPYQRRGVDWLAFVRSLGLGAILADDMGLGKTLQTLCAISGRTLVVCPTSVLQNWANEIERFRPGLKYCMYHGPKRALDPAADVTLTTYALLRKDAGLLKKEPWECVVLDEAQNIKNASSQAARAAYKLQGAFHVAVSGTPVENKLEELWSLFHFCNRGLLGGQSNFKRRFADPIDMGDRQASKVLRERIGPFVLRRLKQHVAPELPPRTEQVLRCELDDKEQQLYNAIKAATDSDVVLRLAEGHNVMAALEALLRLRQAACHSALVPGRDATSSSKIDLLMERLSLTVAGDHKALVFSQWTSLLDLVEPHLQQASIDFCRLDGSTRNRAAVVDEFQDPGGPPVMLISLKAGGTGLNLTQADHVFLLDPWWNPAVEDQAADRTHRIGQDKPVMVYRLVAKDTVEERVLDLQHSKRRLADAALSGADKALTLTKEDLLALLQ